MSVFNGYYLCSRCGNVVKKDEWHQCEDKKDYVRSVSYDAIKTSM